MAGWVYIMTNRRNGTLYVGTTVDLARRVWEHREGAVDGFTKQYGLKRLVYAEEHTDILTAKQREMNIKHWPRAWKVRSSTETTRSGTTSMIGYFEDVGGLERVRASSIVLSGPDETLDPLGRARPGHPRLRSV
jgi:putative endonuclease